MKISLLPLFLAGLMAYLPLSATALMDKREARDTVVNMLGESQSAAAVIAALVADGRGLIDATIFALVSGGEENREAIARAGIASAGSLAEAQSVANALIATAGATGPLADVVAQEMKAYRETLTPPSTYQGSGIATGGGGQAVSPSS